VDILVIAANEQGFVNMMLRISNNNPIEVAIAGIGRGEILPLPFQGPEIILSL
jgi:hypothetical protein